jgi:hypothetical protein
MGLAVFGKLTAVARVRDDAGFFIFGDTLAAIAAFFLPAVFSLKMSIV